MSDDETLELRRVQIQEVTDQILDRAARLADHILDHPGEFLLTAAEASMLREQLRLLRRLRRAHLIEVSG